MGAPGCDDAPVINIEEMPEPNKDVTIIYPYYDNPEFLRFQIERWWSWPGFYRDRCRLIIVDDCSPTTRAAAVLRANNPPFAWVKVFRIEKDVRWNWLAARNIGAHHAPAGWLLITDMDHVIPRETIRTVLCGQHLPENIYRFSRRERNGQKIHPHPNSWFYTRKMFWKIGGYDERMSGYYGSDGYYRRRCAATAAIRIMTAELERHEHEGDSSTTRYLRKQPEDANLRPLVKSFPPGSKPLTLSFPYEEVEL